MDTTAITAASGMTPAQRIKAQKVSKQFESFFLYRTLSEMNKGLSQDESNAQQTWHDMLNQQVAKAIAEKGQGIGIAKILEKDIADKYKAASVPTPVKETTDDHRTVDIQR